MSIVSATIQTLLTDSTFPATPPTTDDPFAFYPTIPKSDEYWTCNDAHQYPLLGGKNKVYFSITQNITNIPPYYSLTVSFSLYQLNTWAIGSLTAVISGTQYFSYFPSGIVYNLCGVLSSHNSTQSFTVGSFIGWNVLVNYTTPSGLLVGYSRFAMRNFITTVLLCNSRCRKCTSYTLASCSKCIDNADIASNCTCNAGYYNVSCGASNKPPICEDICLPCNPTCLTCVNGLTTGCTSCSSGSTLTWGSCIPNCAGGASLTNYIGTDGTCANCITPCYSCLNSTFCYSCSSDSIFYLLASKGQCLDTCPAGTYAQTTSLNCQNCDPNCVTCSGSATNCISCAAGQYLVSNGSCLSCAKGKYYNSSLNSCETCDAPCLTCNGATSKSCLSCDSTAFMVIYFVLTTIIN